MTKVVCYIDSEWAFGQIHYELAKALFCKGVDVSVLPWQQPYTFQEIAELAAVTDVFLTNPNGYTTLIRDYHVDPKHIVMAAHALYDLDSLYKFGGSAAFDDPREFVVVSEFLKRTAETMGVARRPKLLHLGVNTRRYAVPPATNLRTVGIAGKFSRVDPHTGYDLKRGRLIEECARECGLDVKIAENDHHSFVTMAGFYPTVDCVVVASTEEGAGLPALEAAAAGRLVVSTAVGHWTERAGDAGGITIPIEETALKTRLLEVFDTYQNDSAAFAKKCRSIQKHAATYDWEHVIDGWADILAGS